MTNKSRIYFITGVCGVGKSAVIPYLKSSLNDKDYDIHDFDENGVPNNADMKWWRKETERWINFGMQNMNNGISTIVCGFANPEETVYDNNDNIKFILLDANEKTIEQRIDGRYKTEESKKELKRATDCTVEKFIENNTSFLATLRNICEKDERCNVVDTINKSSENVAKQVIEIINSNNIHD
jgi:broad-specificity NMP kinase